MTIKAITIKEWVKQADIDFSSVFVHGVLTAYACKDENDKHWASLLQTQPTLNDTQKQAFQALAKAQKDIAKQLADSELSFQLPINDENNIKEQALSTRDWASGFWLGLKQNQLLQQITDKTTLEFADDLQRIAAMPLPSEEDKDNLTDLLEIQEYCRMGTIGLFLTAQK